ncbi:MAG: efflux RND transporter periplasmic adaptor subunit [Calditrichaeota bacterium]|nr:efflux RND transporter periplasmic adaptor subunit [Calditrichota bacterium]MCB9391071.1 efflux RND transporter periplasmic adaptor subunit [Calditrichota bacterium]
MTFLRISLLLLLSAAFALSCKDDTKAKSKLKLSAVERGDLTQTVVATGSIKPLHQIDIRSKTGGTVRTFYVEEGDWVQSGQRLFEIAPEASPTEQVRTREELRMAEVEVHQAEDDLRIAKELADKQLAPEQNLRDAERTLERAKARLSAAEAEWALIQREKMGEHKEGMEIVRTSTTVLAPISGLIFTRELDEGASVTPTTSASGGTVVLTMGDHTEVEFRGDVDEADIGKLKVGLKTNITVQAYQGQSFEGEIYHISPVGRYSDKEQQIVFNVKAKVANAEEALKVGMSATAKIVVDERKDVPILDEMALFFKGDSAFVKIVTDTIQGATEDRAVVLGISDGIRTEVTSGLDGGEIVSAGTVAQEEN